MEHEIVRSVAAAQKDAQAADALVRQYLPFIKAETAKFLKRIPIEGKDDELGIAMFAFHEAAMAYQNGRGTFLKPPDRLSADGAAPHRAHLAGSDGRWRPRGADAAGNHRHRAR